MVKKHVPVAVSEYMAQIGKKGGKTKPRTPRGPAALDAERRAEIARNAAEARWKNKRA